MIQNLSSFLTFYKGILGSSYFKRDSAAEFSKTLNIDIKNQDLSGQDQVLVSTQLKDVDQSWYWSYLQINVKTSLGLGLE